MHTVWGNQVDVIYISPSVSSLAATHRTQNRLPWTLVSPLPHRLLELSASIWLDTPHPNINLQYPLPNLRTSSHHQWTQTHFSLVMWPVLIPSPQILEHIWKHFLGTAVLSCSLQMFIYRGLINFAICERWTRRKLALSPGRCGGIPMAAIATLKMSKFFQAKLCGEKKRLMLWWIKRMASWARNVRRLHKPWARLRVLCLRLKQIGLLLPDLVPGIWKELRMRPNLLLTL